MPDAEWPFRVSSDHRRECSTFHGSFAYVLWPRTAKRLLSSLPVASSVDAFFSRHLMQGNLRALVVTPGLAAPQTDAYVPSMRYRVVHKRVAVRTTPDPNGFVDGTKSLDDLVEGVALSEDKNWVRIGEKRWLMIEHPSLGTLLERQDPEEDE